MHFLTYSMFNLREYWRLMRESEREERGRGGGRTVERSEENEKGPEEGMKQRHLKSLVRAPGTFIVP